MEQKNHKWIFKVLAKNNARISLLDTFFLKSGTLEFLIYTGNDGCVHQKLPRDLSYRNLGDLLINLKKEFKALQKVTHIGKYICIIVGRNLKAKLDLSGLKDYRNKAHMFPLLDYLQKIKPHNRNEEGWYSLTLTYIERTYKSEFFWKESDKAIPSTQRLIYEMAKNIATSVIIAVEKEEEDRKRVVKLELNLSLDDLGVLWLMNCNCTLNSKEEMIGNEAKGNESLSSYDIRSKIRKRTLYKDKNEDSDKPKIIASDSPIRIKSPNTSFNKHIQNLSEEISQNHPLNRTHSIAVPKMAFGLEQKPSNNGISPERRRSNRSKTTQYTPFSFHAMSYKFLPDVDICKNTNTSLTEQSSLAEGDDSLSNCSINVHFLEILGREKWKIKSRVGNPLRNPTPGTEELKQEMRNIRERFRAFEEERSAKRSIPKNMRQNSWAGTKKIKPNIMNEKIKRSDTKIHLQPIKGEDLLSPLSSVDSPNSPLKLKQIAQKIKSLSQFKSKTPKNLPSHFTQTQTNPMHKKSHTATHSPVNINKKTPKSSAKNPSLPALLRITSQSIQIPKHHTFELNPVPTFHTRIRSLQG